MRRVLCSCFLVSFFTFICGPFYVTTIPEKDLDGLDLCFRCITQLMAARIVCAKQLENVSYWTVKCVEDADKGLIVPARFPFRQPGLEVDSFRVD